MQAFAHVIAQQHLNSWTVWFNDEPQTVCDGQDLAFAIAVLIDSHGSDELEWKQIVQLEKRTCDGHAEFLIPYQERLHHLYRFSLN